MKRMEIPSPITDLGNQTGLVRFVDYGPSGRIIADGGMSEQDVPAAQQFRLQPFLLGDGKPETHYVEFVGEARAPVLRVRPQLEHSFDKTEIAVREAATIADLPAATVTFEGPVKGTHQHPGGDLVVGWTVPGIYVVMVEAFPFLPTEFTLTVGAAS